ncbi:MAG: DUF6089 family protein [Bacteroidota bacterium]
MRYLLLLCIIISLQSQAQDFLSWRFNDRYFSLSLGTGSATYFGELNQKNEINSGLSLLSAGVEARLLSRISARIEVNYLTLQGDDANASFDSFERQRNLSFESRNFQVRLDGLFYFKEYRGDYHRRWIFDPYLISGVGFLRYNPAAQFSNQRFLLREARTEGRTYKKWAVTVPAGFGAKFRINEFVNLSAEILYHFAFTDFIDDVSTVYGSEFASSTAEFLSDRKEEVGIITPEFYDQIQPGAKRGDASNNDAFLLLSLKAEVFIPQGLFSGNRKAVIKKPSAY